MQIPTKDFSLTKFSVDDYKKLDHNKKLVFIIGRQ